MWFFVLKSTSSSDTMGQGTVLWLPYLGTDWKPREEEKSLHLLCSSKKQCVRHFALFHVLSMS